VRAQLLQREAASVALFVGLLASLAIALEFAYFFANWQTSARA